MTFDARRGPAVPHVCDAGRVASPCVNVCTMDPRGRWCLGCLRTLDEIAGWSAFSDDERRAVLARLPGRRAEAAAVAGGAP